MRLARRLLPLLALLLAASVATSSPGATGLPKGWHQLLATPAQGVFGLGSASGRVWFVVEGANGDDTIWSARIAQGALSSPVSTPMGRNDWVPSSLILGSRIESCCVTPGGATSAPLTAGGKVGAWTPLPGDPQQTTESAGFTPPNQGQAKWQVVAGANVGSRTVWALSGNTCPTSGAHQCTINGGGIEWFALCCTAAGQAVDLSARLTSPTKGGASDTSMGVDRHGRLWLAWLDAPSSRPGVAFKLVQVDPTTLEPMSSRTLDHTLLYDATGTGTAFDLVCIDSCRLVYQGLYGAASWDGSGKPTTLWPSDPRKNPGGLLAAAAHGAALDVAKQANTVSKTGETGLSVTTLRGDARGRGLHPVASTDVPAQLPDGPTHYYLPMTSAAVFTPAGLVLFELYTSDRRGATPSRLLTTVLGG